MQKTTWALLILLLGYLLIPEPQTNLTDETIQVIQNKPKSLSAVQKISEFVKSPTQIFETQFSAQEKSLEEIIKTDDYCAFQKFEQLEMKEDRNPYLEAQKLYFAHSDFRDEYEDYQRAIRGEAGYASFTRLYQGLALAGLLTYIKAMPYPRDFRKARLIFHQLAKEDPGNAAPLIYELVASQEIPAAYLNPLIDQILQADRFDGYHLEFLRQLYNADEIGAIAFITKVSFSSALASPNWIEIKDHIKKKFASYPELIEKVGWLLVSGGLQARSSWRDLEWDVLEYSMGRSLIKDREQIPNYVELEKKITGRDTFLSDFKLFEDIAVSCSEDKVEKIREYVAQLRREGHGLASF